MEAPVVRWQVREDVADFCRSVSGSLQHIRRGGVFLACAQWDVRKNSCTITTGLIVQYAVLGHELRHCFDGKFHAD